MSMGMDTLNTQPVKKVDLDNTKSESQVSKEIKGLHAEHSSTDSTKEKEDKNLDLSKKEPTLGTIESAISEMNSKIDMQRTRCEYSYDEPTKRISIKIYDKDTDDLIREVPAEETLKMLQKVWELAGIIVDEKM